jgi:hypothetical protein
MPDVRLVGAAAKQAHTSTTKQFNHWIENYGKVSFS